jgi:hypothetical protein
MISSQNFASAKISRMLHDTTRRRGRPVHQLNKSSAQVSRCAPEPDTAEAIIGTTTFGRATESCH